MSKMQSLEDYTHTVNYATRNIEKRTIKSIMRNTTRLTYSGPEKDAFN
ncbi:MAG: hypothetical protein WAQ24_05805 [Candidatus Saccharimonadales bacterium]